MENSPIISYNMFWKIVVSLYHLPIFTLILTLIFLLLNILDGHSTYLVLKPDHYYREKNPIARWIFKKLKLPGGIIIFKTILMAILIVAISFYTAWDPFTINIALSVADLLFLIVVFHNYHLYRKIR